MGKEKIVILGASRGLGKAFVECLSNQACFSEVEDKPELLLFSRKEKLLVNVQDQYRENNGVASFSANDFSKVEDQKIVIKKIKEFSPDRIFYFAGGGPYGQFFTKNWKDHQWALEVSFLFPAKLLHEVGQNLLKKTQIVFIGSKIAESKADPMAASYSAAKHALKGLINSVQEELSGKNNLLNLKLFSPGYMDTEMLPRNAKPRLDDAFEVLRVKDVAKSLYDFAIISSG